MWKNKLGRLFLLLLLMVLPISIGSADYLMGMSKSFDITEEPGNQVPVAYIIGKEDIKYTSIEKALDVAQNGDIVTVVPPKDKNYHDKDNPNIPDKVSYTISRNCTIKEGVSFVVPTDINTLSSVKNSSTLNTFIESMQKVDSKLTQGSIGTYTSFATASENKYLRVTIDVKDDVNIINKGPLIVSGYLSGGNSNACTLGQTSHSYSKISLGKGASIVQNTSSAKTYSFGYIEETNLNNGSSFNVNAGEVYIPLIIDDYRGFSFSWAMTIDAINTYGSSPFNQFELRNIDTLIKIKYGASIYGLANVYLSYSTLEIYETFDKTVGLVGTTNSSLIQLNNASYSSLECKFNKETLVLNFKAFGGFIFNNLNLEFSKSVVTVNLSTNNAFFPLSYRFEIELSIANGQENAIYDIAKQKMKLLPGCKLTLGDNCTLNASDLSIYSAFYDGSLGNGNKSANAYNSIAYPLKEGAIFKILGNGKINSNNIGGNFYCDIANNITYKNSSNVCVNEAWNFKSSGSSMPAWTIDDYLQINEELQVVNLAHNDLNKIYVGVNSFKNFDSFVPGFNINMINNDLTLSNININKFQKIIFSSVDIQSYSLDFLNNIYKTYSNKTYYKKGNVVSFSSSTNIIGAISSSLSISNNNNGVNEFNVQSITINCETHLIQGNIPLYIDSSIQLRATIVDIDKIYNKTIKWNSLDTSIAIVDQNGKVTGKKLGHTSIQVECDGVIELFEIDVIEKPSEVVNIESISIVDDKDNTSEKVASVVILNEGKENEQKIDCNGSYENDTTVVFSAKINPDKASYSSIKWTFTTTGADRQECLDKGATLSGNTYTLNNSSTITIKTLDGTGVTADIPKVTCTVIALNGTSFKSTFVIEHKADVCFAKGTLITLADGSQVPVENLKIGDYVKTYSFYSGSYVNNPIIAYEETDNANKEIIKIYLSNGENIEISYAQNFFDMDSKNYITINSNNYKDYIGRRIMTYDNDKVGSATITKCEVDYRSVEVYELLTAYDYNFIGNNIMTSSPFVPGVFFNLDDSLKYDEEEIERDIAKYGLYTYEEFSQYFTPLQFELLNFKYYKIAIAKGIFTEEYMYKMIQVVLSFSK